jgi:hypothetical protein
VTFPRPLTQREREVIEALLPDGAFPDVEVYRAQIDDTSVVGLESGADVTLEVGPEANRATFRQSPLPIGAFAPGPDREDEFQVMLWTADGAPNDGGCRGLEHAREIGSTDSAKPVFPTCSQLGESQRTSADPSDLRAPENTGENALSRHS